MQEIISVVTSKGQVTIPAAVRRHLGIATHDKLAFIIEADQVRVAPVGKSVVARTAGLLKGDQPALTPQQENDVFEQAMAEDAEGLTGS
jgi:antitoxin PrlF